jgi:hypothetical protein
MKKKTTSRVTKLRESVATPREVVGVSQIVDQLMTMPEINEAFTRADIELAIDDRGWENFTNTRSLTDNDPALRTSIIQRSRLYWQRDPLAKQSVRLWTDYAIGNGFSHKADDEAIQSQIDDFRRDRANRKIMNAAGQQQSSKKLLIDGEVFFAVFKDATGARKVIRRVDPIQVTDILTDPNDEERPLVYVRKVVMASGRTKTLYYQDWALDEEGKKLAAAQKDPTTKQVVTIEEDVVIYHAAFDKIGKRGNGLLSSVVDWSREHRRFMEARVAIVQALAKFAYKLSVKGGQSVVNSIKSRLESTIAQTGTNGGVERQPQSAPGSSWIQNAGLDMTPMPRVTGAGDAKEDGNALKLMVCAGTGLMLHYFGDPSTGNLATATAMELPMLKMFAGYQQFWMDVYRDLFSIILDEDPDAADAADIDIDFPPILDTDLQKLGTFITQMTTAFPETKIPEVIQMLLVALGVNDIDAIMTKIEAQKKVLDAQQAKMDAATMAAAGAKVDPKAQAALAESIGRLADKL